MQPGCAGLKDSFGLKIQSTVSIRAHVQAACQILSMLGALESLNIAFVCPETSPDSLSGSSILKSNIPRANTDQAVLLHLAFAWILLRAAFATRNAHVTLLQHVQTSHLP